MISQMEQDNKNDPSSHRRDDWKALRLLTHLSQFLSPKKRTLLDEIADRRTRYLTIVLEDIYQPHNASAALRSCECFGIQDIHIIENRYQFRPNSAVVMGAGKWIDLFRYNQPERDNTSACLTHLRRGGYRIVATALSESARPVQDLPLDRPVALLFGTEEEGLSDRALQLADLETRIPMYGFTQSFNLSVSVALCLYAVGSRLRNSNRKWDLSESEKLRLKLNWARRAIRNSDIIERRFLAEDRSDVPD